MNKMANFSFVWYAHTVFFSPDTYKEPPKGDFSLKDAFQCGF